MGKEFERGASPLSLIYSPFLARKVSQSPSMVLAGKGAGGKVSTNNQIHTESNQQSFLYKHKFQTENEMTGPAA